VTQSVAAREIGAGVVHVENLPIGETWVLRETDESIIRSIQILQDGLPLELLQWRYAGIYTAGPFPEVLDRFEDGSGSQSIVVQMDSSGMVVRLTAASSFERLEEIAANLAVGTAPRPHDSE
jgi:hypothetical protein